MPVSQGEVVIGSTAKRVANAVACKSFALSAPSDNVGDIKVGPQGSTTGFPIEPGENVTLDGSGLDDLWATGTEGDVLYWLAAA